MKRILALAFFVCVYVWITGCGLHKEPAREPSPHNLQNHETTPVVSESVESPTPPAIQAGINIPTVVCSSDKDGDELNDLMDIVEGARKDAAKQPAYRSNYYQGGYPPDDEGVCTDVIWRAFKNAGYSLKDMVDKDIKAHVEDYPAVKGKRDANIDFRRVRNLMVYFKKHAATLTTKLEPDNIKNLREWQGGDIVVFEGPDHIAIVSDKRREDGIPYIIHNAGPYTREADELLLWMDGIVGHYRFPRQE